MRLGKLRAERDSRNIKLRTLLRALTYPAEYDFDDEHPGIPTPMFANDIYGNCVIAGRAHQTLRFEYLEQAKLIKITDDDVINEYFSLTHGIDSGLILLQALRDWRRNGWRVQGKRYTIQAFAEIDPTSTEEVKAACYADLGIGIGLAMPDNWQDEIRAGRPWADTSFAPNPYNGHYVYVSGYNATWLTCVTWGRKQQMTWPWFQRYCDEAYAMIDARNKKNTLLNLELLDDFLRRIDKEDRDKAPPEPEPIATESEQAETDADDNLEADRRESGETKEQQAEHPVGTSKSKSRGKRLKK